MKRVEVDSLGSTTTRKTVRQGSTVVSTSKNWQRRWRIVKLTFENATIADAIGKAVRVAPTRGSSFDKANGILFSVRDGVVSVRATNLEVFYHEVVDAVEVEGEGQWRLSSVMLGGFMNKLAIGSSRTITLEDVGTAVVAKSKNTTARFRMLPAQYFPEWQVFDPTELVPVAGFAERLQQVSWAADEKSVPMSGIHLTGEEMCATNRYRIALAPLEIPGLEEPITVPTSIFDPIMKVLGEVKLGVSGGHLLLMPDEQTQITAVIYGDEYPPIMKVVKRDQPASIKFNKTEVIEKIDMSQVFAGSNRMPKMTMIIGREQLAIMLAEADHLFGDVVDIPGQAIHARMNIDFTPRSIMEAINASPSEQVIMHYDPESPGVAVRIDGGSGYEAWVMPRREPKKEEEQS